MMKHKLHFTCLYMLARLALPDQFYPQCIWWCRFVSMLSCLSWVYFVVTHCVLSCCHVSHGFTYSCDTLCASMLSCFSWVYFVVTHCVLPCCHVCHGFFFVVAHCVLPCCHVCHGVTLLWHTVCFHAVMFLMGLLCCGSLCAVMLSCFSWGYFVVAHCVLSCCHACHGVTFLMKPTCNWCIHWGCFCVCSENVHGSMPGRGNV